MNTTSSHKRKTGNRTRELVINENFNCMKSISCKILEQEEETMLQNVLAETHKTLTAVTTAMIVIFRITTMMG